MACTLGYIEDVKQFARLAQLKHAIKDVTPLMEDTINFISEFTCDGQGPSPLLLILTIANSAIRIALGSLLSPHKQEQIDELTKRFNLFKQQFDRGISAQSAGTLEMLLEDMGTVLHLRSKANH
jgi:hypothetical protein